MNSIGEKNLEIYSLVWLDAAVYNSKENIETQQELRNSISHLTTFDSEVECQEYILSVSKDDRIILIVSGQLGENFVPKIYQLQQITAIYVYCMNVDKHQQWSREIKKVKIVTKDFDKLIKKILADQTQRQKNKTNETVLINIYSTDSITKGQSTSDINGDFIHSQLLINCLIRLKSNPIDQNTLIKTLKKFYDKSTEQLKIIEEFQNDYRSSKALWWYTRECFLYRVLNKALRDQDIDLLFLFRFFIHDIQQKLDEYRCTTAIRVYRGQLMSKNEIEMLKSNIKQFISINSFLSTSLNKQTAEKFLHTADNPNDFERVLWTIDADPSLKNIKPFSNIKFCSEFADEEEVLFMIRTIFQLMHIDQKTDGSWVIQLKLCSDNDHQLQSLLQFLENDSTNSNISLISFGDILFKMGRYNEAEKYYQRYLDESTLNETMDIDLCYYSLGLVAIKKDDLSTSLKWLKKSLEIRLRASKSDDLAIADNYSSIGIVYRKMSDLDLAIEMFKKTLAIRQKLLDNYSLSIAECYYDIGCSYERKNMFAVALDYYEKALKINEKQLPKYHMYIGIVHTNIASVYRSLEKYELSLKHANDALEIFRKSLPDYHQRVGWALENIALVYEKQGKLKESLVYFNKALHIYEQILLSTHYYITDVKQNIKRVSSMK